MKSKGGDYYKPSGELQGDTGAIPYRGSETGMTGHDTACGGTSKDRDATNSKGGITGATKSDAAYHNMPKGD